MKKILILITKGEIGGAQVSVFTLAKQLTKEGYHVTVGFGEGDFLQQKLDTHHIPTVRFQHLKRSFGILSGLLFVYEIIKHLRHHEYDAIHLNSSNTLLAAVGAKITHTHQRIIFTHRGLSFIDKDYKKNRHTRWISLFLFRLLLPFVDAQVFVSKENQIQARGLSCIRHDHVIYNGLDPESLHFLEQNQARKQLEELCSRDLSRSYIIGSIGRLSYQKNFEFLIQSFPNIKKHVPHATCIIIGTGKELSSYQQLIRQLDLESDVFLVGAIEDAYTLMKGFDLFVLPSRYEGLSVTLLEALFAGIPILASDVGGARETIPNASYVFPLNDTQTFVDACISLASNEKKCIAIGKENKEKSHSFTISETSKQYTKLYFPHDT